MRTLLSLCLGLFLCMPALAQEYQICTLENDSDIVCDSRDHMRSFLQYIAINDKYSLEKMKKANYCGPFFTKDTAEIRKYDAVSTPIYTGDGVHYIDIAWVKVRNKISDNFINFFMPTNFLNCK